jgi:hypothetical protein
MSFAHKVETATTKSINPSPSGRGLGEGLRICRNLDPHPARSRADLSQRERGFAVTVDLMFKTHRR